MDLNKVMLIGRLTKDPEARSLSNGDMVVSFTLATSKNWTDKATGQKKSQSEFHSIVAWRKLADIVSQYCKKGSHIYIEGHLQTRSWEDTTGKKQYRTEVVADNIIMLGGKEQSRYEERDVLQQVADMIPQKEESVEDLPF